MLTKTDREERKKHTVREIKDRTVSLDYFLGEIQFRVQSVEAEFAGVFVIKGKSKGVSF